MRNQQSAISFLPDKIRRKAIAGDDIKKNAIAFFDGKFRAMAIEMQLRIFS
jgi:hypothetical protein